MRKLVLPFTILMVVSLSGCKKDSLVVVNGICQGYVRDSYSNIPIPGAKINYMIGEKSDSATTDTNGFFVIKGLPAGDTRLIISKVGYAGYLTDTWIEPLYAPASVKGGGSVDSYDEVSVTLPELTGSISGTILKTIGSNNEVRPAAGFDIIVTYDNYYSPSYFSTTTDSKGAFSLSNLPAMYSTVVVKPHSDADNYYYYSTSINLYPNTTSEWYYTLGHSDKGIYKNVWLYQYQRGGYAEFRYRCNFQRFLGNHQSTFGPDQCNHIYAFVQDLFSNAG